MRVLRAVSASLALSFAAARTISGQVRAELRGHVTEAKTTKPIAGAQIELLGRTELVHTADDGSFSLTGLEPRSYTIRVRAIGYAAHDADVEVANGRVTTLDVELVPSVNVIEAVVVRAVRDSASPGATVFDREAIERSGRRDVGELVSTVAGVVVTQAGGPGSETHVSIRGSGANEVLVRVDGAPLNSPITGVADLSQVPLDGVERVVVQTGTQSARYGSRAMAGVIDIETRRASSDAAVSARAGAWGEQSASLSVGDAGNLGDARGAGSISADYRTLRGDFDYAVPAVRGGGTARRVNSDVTSRQLMGAASLERDGASAAIRGSIETMGRGIAGSIVQPSTTGREGQDRQSAGLDAAWHNDSFKWSLTSDVTHEHATYDDPSPPFGSSYHDTVNATGFTASSSVTAERGALSASFGGEARTTSVSSTMLDSAAPRWQRTLGVFAGGRLTRAFDSARTRLDIDAAGRFDNSSLTAGTMFSPRLAASVARGLVIASASVGAGYSPPSLADQFFHEGVLVRPNPALQPERTRQDIEGRLGLHDIAVGPARLFADAAAYHADVHGMILWFPDFQFVWSPSNNDVHRSGWELSARGTWGSDVELQGNLNHASVVYAGPVLSGQVAYQPRTTAAISLGVGPQIARIELGDRYVGARRTVPGSELNSLDPYWLTDLRVRSAWTRGAIAADCSLGIENLLNQPAAMLVDYPFPSRSWTVGVRLRRLDRATSLPR